MTIRFRCPSCKAILCAPDDKAGAKAACRNCAQRLEVPGLAVNQTVLGQPVPAKGNATRLVEGLEGVCISADYDPAHVFRSLFGNAPLVPLSTPEVIRLLNKDWRSLRSNEFEFFLVEVFQALGYRAEKKGQSGDKGLDVLLYVGNKRACVQAKGYDKKVDDGAIGEALKGKIFWQCDICIVVTNSEFTGPAWNTAGGVVCPLIDGRRLPDLIQGLLIPPAALVLKGQALPDNISFGPPKQNSPPVPSVPTTPNPSHAHEKSTAILAPVSRPAQTGPCFVSVSARLLDWPNFCASCLGPTDSYFEAWHRRETGVRIIRTDWRVWKVPFCSRCARLVKLRQGIRSAEEDLIATRMQIQMGENYRVNGFPPLSSQDISFIVIIGFLTCGLGALSYFWIRDAHIRRCRRVLLALDRNRELEADLMQKVATWTKERRDLWPPSGKIFVPPAEYLERKGSVHTLLFHNSEFARLFQQLNAGKIVSG